MVGVIGTRLLQSAESLHGNSEGCQFHRRSRCLCQLGRNIPSGCALRSRAPLRYSSAAGIPRHATRIGERGSASVTACGCSWSTPAQRRSVHLHFDTQHRMGGITLPCPLLAGANVSMARCVLEVRARSRFVASQLLLVKQCLHSCLTLEHGLDQMLAVERVRRATSL